MKFLLIFLLFFLGGCATNVESIKDDKDILVNESSGYILLGIDSNVRLKSIQIEGPKNIRITRQDLAAGSNYILLALQAGEYRLTRIEFSQYYRAYVDDQEYWTFTIKEGEINYGGDIELRTQMFARSLRYHMELINNSSLALAFLKAQFPTILASKAIVYGGPGKDDYLKLWSNQSL
ncbi:hypothetical protein [Pseudoalteromonas luteoviolacea]|uniref:Uncharacterized protein n=1 Tax=Pseudoalteromonas luteoviolacea S4054 TaxID=1129367 RepID=A0A0F6A7Z0_9GAMM|nr:hypothetical protein [Pseudoalteromonas luteoviolacea]AOT07807.1 hypothetical protein S4054249_08120 [Pseudoalteromonas luteoviolacea]AOT12723.1 hypothetical protein S40542_08120 [Pseudoalteromonas luteoviolacea]AOT17636.1 hypothetical protein S4054_08115 [Pseudoalteromonas luteoviolacea]KKE82295.1 hypothetical protein N479_18830 [Pseudoalteromonas luteoviolacea S4054]KZN78947.1 hypothetical protein N481_00460 [Pseudoalteromonas luteoviolacea S4047-1]